MRRILLVLIALSLVVLLAQRVRWWLASDATRIRWRLEEMEEGFNASRLAPCLRGVADGWRDADARVDRDRLADVLRSLFFHEVDPDSGRFLYRVELERETLEIETDPAGDGQARVQVVALFSTLQGQAWSPTWRVRVRAEMAEDEDDGWQAIRSEHETLDSDGRLRRER
jgi:hypothetical protein